MSRKPMLFFSNHCDYSLQYLNILNKHNYIDVEKVCIDVNPANNQRPKVFYDVQKYLQHKISRVPTLVVLDERYSLSGEEAFKWLKYEINKYTLSRKKTIDDMAYNPNEMGSFSDGYAKYGSSDIHDTSEQSFQFINKEYEKIPTLPEEQVSGRSENNFQKDYESANIPQQRRDVNFQESFGNTPNNVNFNTNYNPTVNIPKQQVDFTNSNFGFASQYGGASGNTGSRKEAESNAKLENLIAQRESLGTQVKPTSRNIDWTTGQFV